MSFNKYLSVSISLIQCDYFLIHSHYTKIKTIFYVFYTHTDLGISVYILSCVRFPSVVSSDNDHKYNKTNRQKRQKNEETVRV